MHNDEPTLLDSLDRGALVKEVGESVAHCQPPQVFGIHGDWGLGKTSFLHQVQWYLTGDCPQQSEVATERASGAINGVHKDSVRTVWFDAWRYQNEDAPIAALLQEIRTQLSWHRNAGSEISRIAQVTVRGALLSIDELTKRIGFQYSKFRQANREWEAENMATVLPSHTLRELLHDAIGKLLRDQSDSGPTRLAVFIDDLDRCEPESAYRLLEGLKIYLTLENCVFVLGMNQKAIEEAIGSRLATVARRNRAQRASAYLEKLCQNVWRLPTIRRPGDVLSVLLETTVESSTVRAWIKYAVEVDGQQCLPPNPRRLKGLANLIKRMSEQLPVDKGEDNDPRGIREAQLMLTVAYVYQFHQDLFVRWEADPRLYWKILEWCNGDRDRRLKFFDLMELPKQKPFTDPDQLMQGEIEPEHGVETIYPNPTEASVFWIQPLIQKLGADVAPESFEPYLHRATA